MKSSGNLSEILKNEVENLWIEAASKEFLVSMARGTLDMEKFLEQLFSYAKEQPWVFNMFVLMGQVRRTGMPEEARQVALKVDTIQDTAKLIKKGQKAVVFRSGDAVLLSRCFWASVQGVMEEMAMDKEMKTPDPKWLMSILLK